MLNGPRPRLTLCRPMFWSTRDRPRSPMFWSTAMAERLPPRENGRRGATCLTRFVSLRRQPLPARRRLPLACLAFAASPRGRAIEPAPRAVAVRCPDSRMDSAALASRSLQPPGCRRSAPPRVRPGVPTALRPRRRARASPSSRCQAVAADERSADPAVPEGQNRAISG
jgi:hypothetical protein